MKTSKIREILKNKLRCEVTWDTNLLNFYSVDSSSYEILPKIITVPETLNDIVTIVKFANENKIPIVARGGATGLVGSTLGNGIIMDLKKFDKIRIGEDYIEVGPGVRKGELDQVLKSHNKFFPPNPSVGPYCSIGGMISCNASGSRSLKYGSVIDNLLEVVLVDGKGKVVKLPDNRKMSKHIHQLSKQIDQDRFPKVTKNSCGYRLDLIESTSETQKIIAASEGTLGIVVSAKMKTFRIPKQRLVIIAYPTIEDALQNCCEIMKSNPTALEFVDHNVIKNISHSFPPKTKCLLFVEFELDWARKIRLLKTTIKEGKIFKTITNERKITKWWKFRDSALYYSIKSIKKNHSQLPHIIEDATVPVKNVDVLYKLVKKINSQFKTRSIIYGHAGNGNLHVRLITKNTSQKMIKTIAEYYFKEIIKNGGTISGEHGDGFARSEFVKMQYGPHNYRIFEKLKDLFDPDNILNPGKIITNKSTITKHLRMPT